MQEVISNVYMIEGLRVVNVFVIVEDAGLTLIDAGTSGTVDTIIAQIEAAGHAISDIKRIIITHAHSDHIGGLAELIKRSGAQAIAHQDEVGDIEQTSVAPPTALWIRVLGWLMARFNKLMPAKVAVTVQDGEMIDVLGGLRVIHTPGHTPGCIVLYQPEQQLLFCGDVLFNGNLFTGRGGIRLPPKPVSTDAVQAEASARDLMNLPLETILFGHGTPIIGGAGKQLRRALG